MGLTEKRLNDSLVEFAKDTITEAIEEIIETLSKQLNVPKGRILNHIRRYLDGKSVKSEEGKEAVKSFKDKIESYSKAVPLLSVEVIEAVAKECLNGR